MSGLHLRVSIEDQVVDVASRIREILDISLNT